MSTPRERKSKVISGARGRGARPQSRVGRDVGPVAARRPLTKAASPNQGVAKTRVGQINPMTVQLDIASRAGLTIAENAVVDSNGDDMQAAAEANEAYLREMGDDEYGSDDDLGNSEASQASELQRALEQQLRNTSRELECKQHEAERLDYERNGAELDQAVVSARLQRLDLFSLHLRKVTANRASLLARLAEPLADEHWVLDAASHERMVDTLQGMCGLVSDLPRVADAAHHCRTATPSAITTTTTADSTRLIPQMERLVHEAEQAAQWLGAETQSRASPPRINS
ncbi:hypothetical protein H4R20_004337 [Coemansia guatemalensis]|uniref:Uncharacterized protein n=1 Tax=Coemansia guatemalensis TaxID=2761395 RepID=A0A9W8HUP7_9FUNG|nr:hypothetical protein H4R20_004337 [Coemansia guatemalensis]